LITVGMRHAEIRGSEEYKIREATEFVEDSAVVAAAIESWRKRAEFSVVSGSVMKNGDFFAVLYGLANLGRNSTNLNAIEPFRKLCTEVNGGLEFFLNEARPFKEFQVELFFLFVWDVDEMAALVEQSSVSSAYEWYVTRRRANLFWPGTAADRRVSLGAESMRRPDVGCVASAAGAPAPRLADVVLTPCSHTPAEAFRPGMPVVSASDGYAYRRCSAIARNTLISRASMFCSIPTRGDSAPASGLLKEQFV
jgi:hypothetical protein